MLWFEHIFCSLQLPHIEVINGKERSAVPETGSTVTAKVSNGRQD